jgi:uncharacterized protein (TIGR00730 family)
MKTITIFCSSKQNLNSVYKENVTKVIQNLDIEKYTLAYGGGTTGLMGVVKSEWKGNLITSNMKKFVEVGVEDTFVFDNIVDRQKKLVEIGDAYLIFPGGYGTHYEMLEVITKNDVKEAHKPIFIFNVNNIFDDFILHIKKLCEEGFITHLFEELKIYVETDYEKLVEIIDMIL